MRGPVLLWIQNFFAESTHQTKIGPRLPDTATLISGVIQGSDVGPLMFLVYINELAAVLEKYGITRSSADADNRRDAFSGQSRSTNMVPFWVRCDFSLIM